MCVASQYVSIRSAAFSWAQSTCVFLCCNFSRLCKICNNSRQLSLGEIQVESTKKWTEWITLKKRASANPKKPEWPLEKPLSLLKRWIRSCTTLNAIHVVEGWQFVRNPIRTYTRLWKQNKEQRKYEHLAGGAEGRRAAVRQSDCRRPVVPDFLRPPGSCQGHLDQIRRQRQLPAMDTPQAPIPVIHHQATVFFVHIIPFSEFQLKARLQPNSG